MQSQIAWRRFALSNQHDMARDGRDFGILPRTVPGVLNTDDFIYFEIPSNIDASRYTVVIQSLDTAGDLYKSIGILAKQVELPHVKLGWDIPFGLIPDSPNLPVFTGSLIRASTYLFPSVSGNGAYCLKRRGMWRPN